MLAPGACPSRADAPTSCPDPRLLGIRNSEFGPGPTSCVRWDWDLFPALPGKRPERESGSDLHKTKVGIGEVADVGQDARQLVGRAAEPARERRGELIH